MVLVPLPCAALCGIGQVASRPSLDGADSIKTIGNRLPNANKKTRYTDTFEILLLARNEIEKSLDMPVTLTTVENAFKKSIQGKTIMPPKLYLDLPDYRGDFRAMPAYIDGIAGIKWVSSYPHNINNNMPTVLATIILCDPKTSYPLAIMDGTYITNMRTGATGGLAVKYLARDNWSTIGIVGAGKQAETQLIAIHAITPAIELVKVFDKYIDASNNFAKRISQRLNISISSVKSVQEATECDVLVTTTPSRTPVVEKQHIKPGTHINAIGADAPGKEELAPDILHAAKVVVDDVEQASHSGEINVPVSQGLFVVDEIYGTLGEIVAGIKKGRDTQEEITIFDSTGLAIHDIACAKTVYEKRCAKPGKRFSLFQSHEGSY
jgi:alanine dehydrogenase